MLWDPAVGKSGEGVGRVDGDLCARLVRGVLGKLYSEGVVGAQKYIDEFCAKNPLLGYDTACVGFARALVKAFAESDRDHAVVEAVLRGDRVWVERALMAVRGAQGALYLPEEEKLRLKALEHAFSFILEALDRGLKPRLGG